MFKSLKKIITIIMCVCFLSFAFVGCNNDDKVEYDFDYDCFYGLCEVFGEFGGGLDPGITNDWISDMAGALGVKSFRIWSSHWDLFEVDENNNLSFNASKLEIYHDAVNKMKKAGVKYFLAMTTAFVYPYDYVASSNYVVPDPYEEYEEYLEFMQFQQKAYTMFAKEFPEINYYEPVNEPEFGTAIYRNGYQGGLSDAVNAEYIYTQYEKAYILGDLCWYATKGVQEANPNNKVTTPSLVAAYDSSIGFLDEMYKAIESGGLPAGQEKSDTDPDNYFQVLNWHPYVFNNGELDDEWVQRQVNIYNVAIKHGDGGKPVWLSEFGFTDYGNVSKQQAIADKYIKFLDIVKGKLPFVQNVMLFRLTNMYTQQDNEGEMNFGIMYNPDDPEYGGKPKPAAIAIAKYIRGENADISGLYKYAINKEE